MMPHLFAVEIKSGRTIQPDFFKGLQFFHQISDNPQGDGWAVYGGEERQMRTNGKVAGWRGMPVFAEVGAI